MRNYAWKRNLPKTPLVILHLHSHSHNLSLVSPASRLRAPPRSLADMATAGGAAPLAMDEKARRTRDLLASFYNTDPSAAAGAAAPASMARPSPTAAPASPLDSINSTSFDPDIYMNVLVRARV